LRADGNRALRKISGPTAGKSNRVLNTITEPELFAVKK
jgi:hypothetical protein